MSGHDLVPGAEDPQVGRRVAPLVLAEEPGGDRRVVADAAPASCSSGSSSGAALALMSDPSGIVIAPGSSAC